MGREAGPLRCGSVTDPPKWSISLCCPKKHLILDNNSFYFNEGEWVYLNLIIENPALFVFQIIPDQTPQADVPSLQRAYIFLGASCHFRFASHKLFETSWVPSRQTLRKTYEYPAGRPPTKPAWIREAFAGEAAECSEHGPEPGEIGNLKAGTGFARERYVESTHVCKDQPFPCNISFSNLVDPVCQKELLCSYWCCFQGGW